MSARHKRFIVLPAPITATLISILNLKNMADALLESIAQLYWQFIASPSTP